MNESIHTISELPKDLNNNPILSIGHVIKSPNNSYLSKVIKITDDGLYPTSYQFVMCTGKDMFLTPDMLKSLNWILVDPLLLDETYLRYKSVATELLNN